MAFEIATAYANDWQHHDGVQALTLNAINPVTGESEFDMPDVRGVRTPVDRGQLREIAGAWGNNDTLATWWLWKSTFLDPDNQVPVDPWSITEEDGETSWTILSVRTYDFEPRYECLARLRRE